jgi:tape measure domain-containing protein
VSIARELVTVLRYQLDDSGLRKFAASEKAAATGAQKLGKDVDKAGQSADRTSGAFGRLGGALRGLVAGFSLLSAARIADEWAGVEGRVGLVTEGVEEQKQALDGLYASAQRTRQSYTGLAQVFQGIARNKKELDLSTESALKLAETIGTAMTIGGGSAASQEAALVQLSQALGTGTLRGEELNSIMEQAPRLAQAIAEAFGTTVAKLRDLGKEGKLTSKELAKGLLKQSQKLRAEFERMPVTFSGAWQVLSNALGRQIDKLNRSSGAARVFYRVTSLVVDNLETIIKYLAWIGSAVVLTKLSYAARAMAASGGLLARILARFGGAQAFGFLVGTFLRMLAVATALYYVFDDIWTFWQGGDSVLGRIIGPISEWKWLTDAIAAGLTFIKDALGGGAQSLADWVSKWGLIAVIVGGLVAAIGAIPALVLTIVGSWTYVFNYVRKNWDSLVEDTLYNLNRIKQALLDLIPQGVRNFFSGGGSPGGVTRPVLSNGGGAAFVSPNGIPIRPGAGGNNQSIVNNANVTVNAANADPATVANAASRGTQQGLGAAMVPQVEASR